ncbi:MAG: DUF1801 domain-containing protein [Anaerolineaceae bacterium]|nr:DUF1801 domain-containing protein [Anaerolineaceae bacterium]
MQGQKDQPQTIDAYIAQFPPKVQATLQGLRATIHAAAPQATEKISYQMPTFYLKGNLVHFAAYKNHIGFYPASHVIDVYKNELIPYKTSKGTVQFPIDHPLPLNLVSRMVTFRVAENLNRDAEKRNKSKTKQA